MHLSPYKVTTQEKPNSSIKIMKPVCRSPKSPALSTFSSLFPDPIISLPVQGNQGQVFPLSVDLAESPCPDDFTDSRIDASDWDFAYGWTGKSGVSPIYISLPERVCCTRVFQMGHGAAIAVSAPAPFRVTLRGYGPGRASASKFHVPFVPPWALGSITTESYAKCGDLICRERAPSRVFSDRVRHFAGISTI